MHIIKIISALLFLLMGCNTLVEHDSPQNAKLQISFQNNSERTLKNLIVSGISIGSLRSNSSSSYFPFENFRFDTGMPDVNASAEIEGKTYNNYHRNYWCGTEKIAVDSGKYLIEIEVIDTVLYLSCKNAPRIKYP